MKRIFILISAIAILLTCISPSIAETTFAEITLITYVREKPDGKKLFVATMGSQFEVVSERDIWIEIRVDETTTGFIPKNSCRIFHQTLNGFKQMTIEEFDTRVMELREIFWPLIYFEDRGFLVKLENIDQLFFVSNIESCMDILDKLVDEKEYIKAKYVLFGNSVARIGNRVFFSVMLGLRRNNKLDADFSLFIYDEKKREEIKPICDLYIKIMKELWNKKPEKNNVKEFINLIESRPSSLGNRAFLYLLLFSLQGDIANYVLSVPQIEQEKYLSKETLNHGDFSAKEGVVLNKDSDNTTELLVYLYEQINSYLDDVSEEMIEFDENYLAQRKEKFW